MNEQSLVSILAIVVIMAAVALLIQLGFWIAIYGVFRRMQRRAEEFMPRVKALTEFSRAALVEEKKQIDEITAISKDILNLTRIQLARLDEFYNDVKTRIGNQRERAELVFDDTVRRVYQPVKIVRKSIMIPVRTVHGVVNGVRTAIITIRRRVNVSA